MKYLWVLGVFLFKLNANAVTSDPYATLEVNNVRVSAVSDSADAAKEQALEQGHRFAFQQLMKENFPQYSDQLPSKDSLMDMVSHFSIDREKTTSTSYTASLAFQFDESKVRAWLQQRGSFKAFSLPHNREREPLQVIASYKNLGEWNFIRKSLESISEIKKVNVVSFSSQNATMEITYNGDIKRLQSILHHHQLSFSSQEDGWLLKTEITP